MTPEEYRATRELIMGQARVVQVIPLQRFVSAIDFAESLGPVMDPTLFRNYQEGNGPLVKKLAVALLEFQRVVEEVKGELE